jgi:hypothetical protein
MHRPHITKRELRSIATIEANRCKLLLDGGLGVGIACGVFRLIEARDAIIRVISDCHRWRSSFHRWRWERHKLTISAPALLRSKAASKSLNPECVQHRGHIQVGEKVNAFLADLF